MCNSRAEIMWGRVRAYGLRGMSSRRLFELWLGFDFPAAGFVFAVGEAVAHGVEGVAGGIGGDAFFVDADAAVFEGEETDEGG